MVRWNLEKADEEGSTEARNERQAQFNQPRRKLARPVCLLTTQATNATIPARLQVTFGPNVGHSNVNCQRVGMATRGTPAMMEPFFCKSRMSRSSSSPVPAGLPSQPSREEPVGAFSGPVLISVAPRVEHVVRAWEELFGVSAFQVGQVPGYLPLDLWYSSMAVFKSRSVS